MKFNEKLIELRKKEGLSQEELGYKLNVTRQTVSKWELGQTTPEMDKLSEISNLFGVSVDSLLNDTEEAKIEDKTIVNNNDSSKKVALIIIGVVAGLGLLLVLMYAVIFNGILNFGKKAQDDGIQIITDGMKSIVNYAQQQEEKDKKESEERLNAIKEEYNQKREESEEKAKKEQQELINQFYQMSNEMEQEYNQKVDNMQQQVQKQQQELLEQAQKQQQQLLQQFQ